MARVLLLSPQPQKHWEEQGRENGQSSRDKPHTVEPRGHGGRVLMGPAWSSRQAGGLAEPGLECGGGSGGAQGLRELEPKAHSGLPHDAGFWGPRGRSKLMQGTHPVVYQ